MYILVKGYWKYIVLSLQLVLYNNIKLFLIIITKKIYLIQKEN